MFGPCTRQCINIWVHITMTQRNMYHVVWRRFKESDVCPGCWGCSQSRHSSLAITRWRCGIIRSQFLGGWLTSKYFTSILVLHKHHSAPAASEIPLHVPRKTFLSFFSYIIHFYVFYTTFFLMKNFNSNQDVVVSETRVEINVKTEIGCQVFVT